MAVAVQDQVSRLVDEALAEVGRPDVPSSAILDKAIRIARLRKDGLSLIWLLQETRTLDNADAHARILGEVRPMFASDELANAAYLAAIDEWNVERTVDNQVKNGSPESRTMLAMSVRELEAHLEALGEMSVEPHGGASSADWESARRKLILRRGDVRGMLARIRTRLNDYLSLTEQELIVSAGVSSTFEQQRAYVDARLREVAPAAFEQLASAYDRRAENYPEARSQALTSCRRALKSVADVVYAARSEPAVGSDGQPHEMTDSRYIARLLQFVYEQRRGKTSAELLSAQIEHLGARLEALNDLASKGVHGQVSREEVDQTVLETYMVVGEVLRLGDEGQKTA